MEADRALEEGLWQSKSLFQNAHVAMWEVDAFVALARARDIEREGGHYPGGDLHGPLDHDAVHVRPAFH